MFLSYQATEEHCSSDLWLLDSNCNNHMIGNKSLFSSLDSSVVMNIKLGGDILIPAKVKGAVPVFTKKNEKKFIHEVFYVPHLNVNLITMGQLLHNNYDLRFFICIVICIIKPP